MVWRWSFRMAGLSPLHDREGGHGVLIQMGEGLRTPLEGARKGWQGLHRQQRVPQTFFVLRLLVVAMGDVAANTMFNGNVKHILNI